MQHDDIGVAFDDHGDAGRCHGRLGDVQAEEHPGLMEQRSFLRVEILGLALAYDAPPEGDGVSVGIADRKHHALVEAVAQTSVLLGHKREVSVDKLFGCKTLGGQMPHERLASRSVSEVPTIRHGTPHVARCKIGARGCGAVLARTHELKMIELRRSLARFLEARFLSAKRRSLGIFRDLDARTLRQKAHRIGEPQIIDLHDERDDVAALAAAETMPELRRGVDLERGRFLVMERAATPEITSALAQLDPIAHDGDQIARFAHATDVSLGNARH